MTHFIFGYAAGVFTIPIILILLTFGTKKGRGFVTMLKPVIQSVVRNMKMKKQDNVRHLK
jgi:hypothetical protein